jgi:hypothetical protein
MTYYVLNLDEQTASALAAWSRRTGLGPEAALTDLLRLLLDLTEGRGELRTAAQQVRMLLEHLEPQEPAARRACRADCVH